MTKMNIASLLVAFGVGVLSAKVYLSSTNTDEIAADSSSQCSSLQEAQANLLKISQSEYQHYLAIKDLKEKYEKADELLGRVMLLFLAEVGLKTKASGEVSLSEDSSPSNRPSGPETSSRPSIPQQNQDMIHQTAQHQPQNTAISATIARLEKEEDILVQLKKAEITSPKIEHAQGNLPTAKQVELLAGRYSGFIRYLNPEKPDLSVTWDLNVNPTEKGLEGTFVLKISGQGVNSETSGRGTIENIVSLASDTNGFFVSSCGDRCFLQLYYSSATDRFHGSYYETTKENPKGKPVRVGYVEMRR